MKRSHESWAIPWKGQGSSWKIKWGASLRTNILCSCWAHKCTWFLINELDNIEYDQHLQMLEYWRHTQEALVLTRLRIDWVAPVLTFKWTHLDVGLSLLNQRPFPSSYVSWGTHRYVEALLSHLLLAMQGEMTSLRHFNIHIKSPKLGNPTHHSN